MLFFFLKTCVPDFRGFSRLYRVRILPGQRNSHRLAAFFIWFQTGVAVKEGQFSALKFYLISIKIISCFTIIAYFSLYFFLHLLGP